MNSVETYVTVSNKDIFYCLQCGYYTISDILVSFCANCLSRYNQKIFIDEGKIFFDERQAASGEAANIYNEAKLIKIEKYSTKFANVHTYFVE